MRMSLKTGLNEPKTLLFLLTIGNTVAFATWQVLLNNFVVERASFSGEQIGILQSLREVPGFLAFTAVWIMLILRQQFFALVALFTLGFGTAITATYPSASWIYFATVVMSIGFHYLETVQTSLSLQWLPVKDAPYVMGQLLSAKSLCNFLVLGALYPLSKVSKQGGTTKNAIPKESLLALLPTHLFSRRKKANFRRIRRVYVGRKV